MLLKPPLSLPVRKQAGKVLMGAPAGTKKKCRQWAGILLKFVKFYFSISCFNWSVLVTKVI